MRRLIILVGVWLGLVLTNSIAASTNGAPRLLAFSGVGEAREAKWSFVPMANGRDLRISIECTGVSAVQVEGGYSLRIPGQASAAKPGTPDLPRIAKVIAGIEGARPILTLGGRDPTNVAGVAVAAVAGFMPVDSENAVNRFRPSRNPDPAVYGRNLFWPTELGRLEEACIGTQNVVRLECFPVQYNPATGAICLYRHLEGELRFETRP